MQEAFDKGVSLNRTMSLSHSFPVLVPCLSFPFAGTEPGWGRSCSAAWQGDWGRGGAGGAGWGVNMKNVNSVCLGGAASRSGTRRDISDNIYLVFSGFAPCPEHMPGTGSCLDHRKPRKTMWLYPFYRRGHWGTEGHHHRFWNLPLTELGLEAWQAASRTQCHARSVGLQGGGELEGCGFLPPEDIWQCLQAFSVVCKLGECYRILEGRSQGWQ